MLVLNLNGSCLKQTFNVFVTDLPDLVLNIKALMTSLRLQDQPLYYLRCSMEENCLSSSAYVIQKTNRSMLESTGNLNFVSFNFPIKPLDLGSKWYGFSSFKIWMNTVIVMTTIYGITWSNISLMLVRIGKGPFISLVWMFSREKVRFFLISHT